MDRCCLWFVSVTTCWNKLAQSESENTKLKSSVHLSWRKQRYDLITAMKDVRCIQRECSFRRDRTLLYCNISCESTDGLLLLLLDTLSKHLAADWMNHLSISGLLQSVRSAARGERPTSRTNWWIKLSMKRKNTSASCCSSHTTSNWKPDGIGSRMTSQIQKCNDKPPGFLVNI